MALVQMKKRSFATQRSPTLNTVLMIEETLQKIGEVLTVAELKRKLPKKVMHQTLIGVLEYLEFSGKITYHDNQVLWTFKPRSELRRTRGLRIR